MSGLKLLGSMTLAALLTSTVTASATNGATFTIGETPNTHINAYQKIRHILGGKEGGYFEFNGTEVICEETVLTSPEAESTVTEFTVSPEYNGCQAGEFAATIVTNECYFALSEPSGIGEAEFTGAMDLECPGENGIEIHAFLGESHGFKVCNVRFKPGGEPGNVSYAIQENAETKKDDILTVIEQKNGSYVQEGLCGAKSGTDGVIISKYTDTAHHTVTKEQLDYWISE